METFCPCCHPQLIRSRTRTAPVLDDSAEGGSTAGEGMHLIKRTFQPSVLRRKRAHGFLNRLKTRDGRKILARRRAKHRTRMAG